MSEQTPQQNNPFEDNSLQQVEEQFVVEQKVDQSKENAHLYGNDGDDKDTEGLDIAKKQRLKRAEKIVDILLIIAIVVLSSILITKAFFVTNVAVSGESMLNTFTNGQTVMVERFNCQKNVTHGDVVVFYVEKPTWFADHFHFFGNRDASTTNPNRLLIKRVVALQGDKIWVEDVYGGVLFKVVVQKKDGTVIEENYYTQKGEVLSQNDFYINATDLQRLAGYTQQNPYVIPDGYFFAMGDNRGDSHDSRYEDLGDIPLGNLFGIVSK